jgi:hypothetical protein
VPHGQVPRLNPSTYCFGSFFWQHRVAMGFP